MGITPEINDLGRYTVEGQTTIIKGGPGPVVPIDVTPTVNDLGRWAVEEHNKKQHTHLKFNKVCSAKEQLKHGFTYYLTLEAAADGGKNNVYEATVLVSMENVKKLEEFKLVGHA